MKSSLPRRKIYFSQTDGCEFFQALPLYMYVQWRSKEIYGCCTRKSAAMNWKDPSEETCAGKEGVEPKHQAFCRKVFALSWKISYP